jgi:hypothetical protein
MKSSIYLGMAGAALVLAGGGTARGDHRIQSGEHQYDYAIVRGDGHVGLLKHWDGDDLKALKSYRSGDRLFVRKDGVAYIITDYATLQTALRLQRPVVERANKMAEAGVEMGQEAVEHVRHALAKMNIDVKVPDVQIPRIDVSNDPDSPEFEAKMEAFSKRMEEWGEKLGAQIEKQVEKQMDKADASKDPAAQKKMTDFAAKMQEFGKEMGAFGEKMGEKGSRIGEEGAHMGELADKANKGMNSLIDSAFKHRVAHPVH